MKYTLTVEADTPDELSALLNGKSATVNIKTTAPAPVADAAPPVPPTTANDDDDEDDDTAAPDGDAPERDKRGFIWDERIHASSKKLNADGTWRYRRNTPKETIEAVEAELTAKGLEVPPFLQRGPNDGEANAAPAASPDPQSVPVPTSEPAATPAEVPVPTGAPANPTETQAPAITYERVIAMITEALQAGKLTPDGLPAFWQEIGVTTAVELVGNQPALDAAYAKLALL